MPFAVLISLVWALLPRPATASRLESPHTGFDVIAYDVAMEPDLRHASIRGTETIRMKVKEDGLVGLAFSPNALSITKASLNGRRIAVRSTDEAITFEPATPLAKGADVTLSFAFRGKPRRGFETVPDGLYTSYFACDWMVCLQDSPGDKARLALAITAPTGWSTIAPGRLVGSRAGRHGTTIHRWRSDRPYSPYLYAFAAGVLRKATVHSTAGELTYLDATGGHADFSKAFKETPSIVTFLSSKAGLALPKPFAQLLVPGHEAQEAASLSLIGAAALQRDLSAPESQWLLVHELSHQWWGNLVTCASWRDFWLNEGFATFMTAAWKEQRFGKAAYEAELDVARRRLAAAREKGFDKPLTWEGDYPSLGTRRAVQYSKGALFLDSLRKAMGEEAFWSGIRRYTRAHAGGTVTSEDFQRSMQHGSARDLSPLFATWVFGHSPKH